MYVSIDVVLFGNSLSCLSYCRLLLWKECSSSYTTGEELCRKLEELERFLKQEPDSDEEVDILNITEPLKINIKTEQEEKQEEANFYLASQPASEFVKEAVQQVEKSVFKSMLTWNMLMALDLLLCLFYGTQNALVSSLQG